MALLMAGQQLLADDHTWTGWQPHTQATFKIIIPKHMHDADKASQARGRSIFQQACAQGTPKWDSGLT